jgi:hypothetical protein
LAMASVMVVSTDSCVAAGIWEFLSVRGQRSEVRGQRSEVRGHGS